MSGAPRRRPARSRARRRSGAVALGLTVVLLAATASGAAAATSGHAAGETDGETTATTVDPSLAKGTVPFILCKTPVAESVEPSDDVELLVENLISQAGLPEADPYGDPVVRCDNTGVTTMEAPPEYADIDPNQFSPPQTAIRVSTDLGANVEAAPIVNYFAAAVGGSQYPTQPGFATLIQQSADGSLSSGTREPRAGTTISEDCQGLPIRDLSTGTFTGKARFFVNCGGDARAWVLVAAAPSNGAPYFVQVVAQVQDTADAAALGHALSTMAVDAGNIAALATAQDAAAAAQAGSTSTTAAAGATTTTAAP